MNSRTRKISTSLTLSKEDLDGLDNLKMFEEETRSAVVRRLIRTASERLTVEEMPETTAA